jgi:general stress protein 26
MRAFIRTSAVVVCSALILAAGLAAAQDAPRATPDRAAVVAAARDIMTAQTYCALITLDSTGRPQVRTMNPFPPEEDMTVWIATNANTRKAAEIRQDPRVTLYYADHGKAIGYVAMTGRATLVDDMKEILKRRRAYWDDAFPGLKNLVLIKVVPEQIDVVNYKAGALNDPRTWRSPWIAFGPQAPQK